MQSKVSVGLCGSILSILLAGTAHAGPTTRVDVCHVPPGNPDNFHTITVSQNALQAHLAHGDVSGACNDNCAVLCDDGDACTVDDFGDCEAGCPTEGVAVDCDDGSLCTMDSCVSDVGCINDAVVCEATNECFAAVCSEVSGLCVENPDETGCEGSGCADGEREGFTPAIDFTDIAACSGGWSEPGVLTTTDPTCGQSAGDDSSDPTGSGCNVSDLCAVGWHVCDSAADFDASSPTGCMELNDSSGSFFVTRQSGPGFFQCNATGANDLFGCGGGGPANAATCSPLTTTSGNLCGFLTTEWNCGSTPADSVQEADIVVKADAGGGGVLCCRD